MNWFGIIIVGLFIPGLCIFASVAIMRADADQLNRPGAIPDEVTRWRDHPFSVLEESEPPFYDWQADSPQ